MNMKIDAGPRRETRFVLMQVNMLDRVSEMGLTMGQTLVSGDLASLMAHKRLSDTLRKAKPANQPPGIARHLRSHR